MLLAIAGQACSLGGLAPGGQAGPSPVPPTTESVTPTDTVLPPTETAVPATATVVHLVRPAEVPPEQFFLSDASSAGTNEIQRALAGDNYGRNRLERPFAAPSMDYRPDLDIVRVEISSDGTWFYFTMILNDVSGGIPDGPVMGPYGLELDLDTDGRGDLMVRGSPIEGSDWSTDTVQVWADSNGDVGSTTPMNADAPQAALDGYDALIFDRGAGEDPDAAWVRTARIEDAGVQFAVKRSFVGDEMFLWGGWADDGLQQPGWIDYNDHFSAAEAGSLDSTLGAVAAVDNTCRMYFGYTPSGSEPGLCVVTGTVRNCSPHPMRMEPGGTILPPFFDSGSTITGVRIGTYTFYDESVEGNPSVLTAQLSPGGLITITKTGFGDNYPCQ
jgi:hypothetical protein